MSLEGIDESVSRAAVASMLQVDERRLEESVEGMGDELAFHLLSDPTLRSRLLGLEGRAPAEARRLVESDSVAESALVEQVEPLRSRLSSSLRERLS